MNMKAYTANRTGASYLESLLRHAAYRHALEGVNALDRMLVSTANCLIALGFSLLSSFSFLVAF